MTIKFFRVSKKIFCALYSLYIVLMIVAVIRNQTLINPFSGASLIDFIFFFLYVFWLYEIYSKYRNRTTVTPIKPE